MDNLKEGCMFMDIDKEELLAKIKETLKGEVSEISYATWISSLGIQSISNNHIVFTALSEYQRDFIENRFKDLIFFTLKHITNREYTFSVLDLSSKDSSQNEVEIIRDKASSASDTEIESNHKTHLMQAIGNRIVEENRKANVLYVTAEKFTNQLINAIKDNKTEVFRNKYRTIDTLLIDDIQFIAGKDRSQEEFFHTFNTLRDEGKQIVISSDKAPKDIEFLEDRLKSRFEGGLLADISCPDYETRLAILRKKAQDEKIIVDDSILSDIALKIDSNVRELEGVFNKIVVTALLTHSPITLEQAELTINEFILKSEKVISGDFIKETVAKYFRIDKNDLVGEKRSNDIAFPRQISMFLCREIANMSFPQIGKEFGNRDHSTVMHAYNKIKKEVKENINTKRIVESVKNIIVNDTE